MHHHILKGKHILITNGPTREPLDPVRYISNHSTGKMGNAIARALLDAGAKVTMIAGPLGAYIQHPNLQTVMVQTALEMLQACNETAADVDAFIFTAAVADYRPAEVADGKIKKSTDEINLRMVKNPDIAMELGLRKQAHQLSMGFALETTAGLSNAMQKMEKKLLDWIVLNNLRDIGAGFGADTNKVTVLDRNGTVTHYPLMTKQEVAVHLIQILAARWSLFINSSVLSQKYESSNSTLPVL